MMTRDHATHTRPVPTLGVWLLATATAITAAGAIGSAFLDGYGSALAAVGAFVLFLIAVGATFRAIDRVAVERRHRRHCPDCKRRGCAR